MTTTVKENFAVFALFVCFVALRPSPPILHCRDITSILCDFYPTLPRGNVSPAHWGQEKYISCFCLLAKF